MGLRRSGRQTGTQKAAGNQTKEEAMLKAGDVLENPVTGERAVVRVGTAESGGELLVADLYVRPGGAVMGEHFHPAMEESFAAVRGRLGYRLEGREDVAGPGSACTCPTGRSTTGGTRARRRPRFWSRSARLAGSRR